MVVRYTTVTEVREAPDLADPVLYPDALLERAIESTAELIETFTGAVWQTTIKSVKMEGFDSTSITLPLLYVSKVRSITYSGGAINPAHVEVFPGSEIKGCVKFKSGVLYNFNVEYGIAETPEAIKFAARIGSQHRARLLLTRARQRSSGSIVNNEHGSFSYPNWSGRFGPSDDGEVLRILNTMRVSGIQGFS